MIKEIKILIEKYKQILKNSDYVSVVEVGQDLYNLLGDARIKRLPKNER